MSLETIPHPNLSGIPANYGSGAIALSDSSDNCGDDCVGLYATGAGIVSVVFADGTENTTLPILAKTVLPGRFKRVKSTATTATGIFAVHG